MWEQYKKTFWPIQIWIAAVAVAVFIWFRVATLAGVFFCAMQLASVAGGLWARRLKRKLELLP